MHGEIEIFNKQGRHLGSAEPIFGELIKPAVKGRKLNV
ncbi:colicin E3/pyocin S6 family cytotoxin [Bacillus velezensis]